MIKDTDAVDLVKAIVGSANSRHSDYYKLCLIYDILEHTNIDTTHLFGSYNDGHSKNKATLKTMYGSFEIE